jgi:hypothetical protein
MKLRQSSNPAERSFFKHFIAPDLGPKLFEKKPDLNKPLYSFIDKFGDEIRLSLTSTDDYSWDWEVVRFTQGADNMWYRVRNRLIHGHYHDKLLLECAKVLYEATQQPIDQPEKNIAKVKMLLHKGLWYLLTARPNRRRVECSFQKVFVSEKQTTYYPYPFCIDSESLPHLIRAGEILIVAIDKFFSERKRLGIETYTETWEVAFEITKL